MNICEKKFTACFLSSQRFCTVGLTGVNPLNNNRHNQTYPREYRYMGRCGCRGVGSFVFFSFLLVCFFSYRAGQSLDVFQLVVLHSSTNWEQQARCNSFKELFSFPENISLVLYATSSILLNIKYYKLALFKLSVRCKIILLLLTC